MLHPEAKSTKVNEELCCSECKPERIQTADITTIQILLDASIREKCGHGDRHQRRNDYSVDVQETRGASEIKYFELGVENKELLPQPACSS